MAKTDQKLTGLLRSVQQLLSEAGERESALILLAQIRTYVEGRGRRTPEATRDYGHAFDNIP